MVANRFKRKRGERVRSSYNVDNRENIFGDRPWFKTQLSWSGEIPSQCTPSSTIKLISSICSNISKNYGNILNLKLNTILGIPESLQRRPLLTQVGQCTIFAYHTHRWGVRWKNLPKELSETLFCENGANLPYRFHHIMRSSTSSRSSGSSK